MGLLHRINKARKVFLLKSRLGKDWAQFYVENDLWPNNGETVDSGNQLVVEKFGLKIPFDRKG